MASDDDGLRIAFDLGHEANAAAREPLARLIVQASTVENFIPD